MTDKTYALVITVVAAVLASVVSFAAFAQVPPVITYQDGSTYTLKNGEEVYVHAGPMYIRQDYANTGDVIFKKRPPWPKRDSEQTPSVNTGNPGEHQWCKDFKMEGFSFAYVSWNRYCDTNNDSKYGCGDDPWDASEDGAACPSS